MNKYPQLFKHLYREKTPYLWQQRIDLLRGESQVFRPCFQPTKSIFIHIPKAAGTSIARAIYGMNVGHKKASDYQKISIKEFSKYYTYSFVRNPWDRAISAYNFAKQGGTELVQPLPSDIYASKYFRTFSTFVKEWLPYADLGKEDVVFAPQYEYICDGNQNIIIDFVGKLENITQGIDIISNKIGQEIHLENLNTSNRIKPTYKEYYTNELIDIIAKVYEVDISLFDYDYD